MPMEDGLPEFRTMSNAEPEIRIVRSSPTAWLLLLLVLGAVGAAGWWYWPRWQAKDAELATANAHAQELQKRVDALSAQVSDLTGKLDKLQAEKSELAKDVAEKSDALARLQGTYDQLADKMKAEIAKGDIQLSQSGGRLQVDMVDKILFDSGDATISKRGQEILQRLGAVLATIDDKQIQVSGHTDDSPISSRLTAQYPSNWELSSARAVNVVRFLTEKAHVSGKRLVASGYGQFHPIASNANPTGRARNRRIEILLTPLLETVPTKVASAKAVPAAPAKPAVLTSTRSHGTVKPASAKRR